MNTLVRIRGWVVTANVIEPETSSFVETNTFYRLGLQPQHPYIFEEIESMAEELKLEHENSDGTRHSSQDRLIDGCLVLFETLHQPRIEGELRELEHDDELLGKFVQAVGHMQILKDGNVYLSMHIIEPTIPLDGFDPLQ